MDHIENGMHGAKDSSRSLHGPANERWFLQRTEPSRQIRNDFSNGPGRQMLGDFSNKPGRPGKKKNKINYEPYLANNKCKCANVIVFHYRIINKNL